MGIFTNKTAPSYTNVLKESEHISVNDTNALDTMIVNESLYRETLTNIYREVFPSIKYNDTDMLKESVNPIVGLTLTMVRQYRTNIWTSLSNSYSNLCNAYGKLSSIIKDVPSNIDIASRYEKVPVFTYNKNIPDFEPFDKSVYNLNSEYEYFLNADKDVLEKRINAGMSGGAKKKFTKVVLCDNAPNTNVYEYTKRLYNNNGKHENMMVTEDYIRSLCSNRKKYKIYIQDIRNNIDQLLGYMNDVVSFFDNHKELCSIDTGIPLRSLNLQSDRENQFVRFELDKFYALMNIYFEVISGKIDGFIARINYEYNLLDSIRKGNEITIVKSIFEATDYHEELLREMYKLEQEYTADSMYDIEEEAVYILNCLESNTILTEAEEKKKNIFARFIDAIKNLFSKFFDKAKELVNKNTWNDELLNKLDNVDYTDMQITCLPLWSVSNDECSQIIDKLVNAFKNINKDNVKEGDLIKKEDIIKNEAPFKMFYDDNIGYKKVMKRVFTVKNENDTEAATYTGAKAKNVAEYAKEYIKNYQNDINKINTLYAKFTTELKTAEKQYNVIKDSMVPFLDIENRPITESDLRFCCNFAILYEADKPEADTKEEKEKGEVGSVTKVSVNNGDDNKDNDNTEPESLEKGNKTHQLYTQRKSAMASIIVDALAILMTVMEEKLIAYQSIIRAVLNVKKKPEKDKNKSIAEDKESKIEAIKKDIASLEKEGSRKNKTKIQKLKNALKELLAD